MPLQEKDNSKMVAFRDPFKTYHNKLEDLCEHYIKNNPDNKTPDELARVKKSWFLRYLIDNAHNKLL